jgi:hypothetical protein
MSATMQLLKAGKNAALKEELSSAPAETAETVEPVEPVAPAEDNGKEAVAVAEDAGPSETQPTEAPPAEAQAVVQDAADKPKKPKTGKKSTALAISTVLTGEVVAGSDLILDTAHAVENLTREDAIKFAKQIDNTTEVSDFKLGALLSVIDANHWYEPYTSFREFCETEFNCGYRKAKYLVKLYRELVDSGVPWSKVAQLGWTKLKDLAPVLNEGNVDGWVEKAEASNVAQLQQLIKASKDAEGGNPAQLEAPEKLGSFTVKLSDSQKAVVKAAVAKCKEVMEKPDTSDGYALEMIATEFLNTSSGGLVGAAPANAQPVDPEAALKAHMHTLGIGKVLETLEQIWPKIEMEVKVPEEYLE